MRQVRTDMALEASQAAGSIPGVHVSQWEEESVSITEVRVETEEAAQRLGKSVGTYLTLECEGVRRRDPAAREEVQNVLGEEIARLLPPDEQGAPVLVVGLGNRRVTPDSLGPKTVDGTLVTRHLLRELPDKVDERLNPVCAIAPGVMGATGLETMETVSALVKEIHPRCLIVIDSLAARASSRVGVSIQLSDTGIQPGSGVGNHRRALNERELGVRVIALGMPTVVYAVTIARDALEILGEGETNPAALDEVTKSLFENEIGEMIVTPREVDDMIDDAAQMLAGGINRALQTALSPEEIAGLGRA
ncbi:MAG: GPR endopeptidase [Eubacteriales bacterium]|nr:GPR endopeptidase [Eubacteriales bacterium]